MQGSPERLGYLGLGMMGSPMTRRLLSAGYPVTIWNRSQGKTAPLVSAGAKPAADPSAVANTSSIIFLCLTDAGAVEDVVFGPGGLAMASGAEKLVVRFLLDPPGSHPINRETARSCQRHGMDRRAGLGRHKGG